MAAGRACPRQELGRHHGGLALQPAHPGPGQAAGLHLEARLEGRRGGLPQLEVGPEEKPDGAEHRHQSQEGGRNSQMFLRKASESYSDGRSMLTRTEVEWRAVVWREGMSSRQNTRSRLE